MNTSGITTIQVKRALVVELAQAKYASIKLKREKKQYNFWQDLVDLDNKRLLAHKRYFIYDPDNLRNNITVEEVLEGKVQYLLEDPILSSKLAKLSKPSPQEKFLESFIKFLDLSDQEYIHLALSDYLLIS